MSKFTLLARDPSSRLKANAAVCAFNNLTILFSVNQYVFSLARLKVNPNVQKQSQPRQLNTVPQSPLKGQQQAASYTP
jgi:hypothetical protein